MAGAEALRADAVATAAVDVAAGMVTVVPAPDAVMQTVMVVRVETVTATVAAGRAATPGRDGTDVDARRPDTAYGT